jgi:ubiquinone/menaquinone biosynthesis C-methylase UbiE
VGNAEKLEFEDCTFDVVYAFGVLHHTPDIGSAVREIFRVLKPNGTAYVMLYHRNSLVNLIHWLFRLPYESPRDLKDHCPVVYTFSKKSVRELFSQFKAIEIHADYPFTYGFRYLTFWIPRVVQKVLGRLIGWHLMIRAVR